MNEREYIEALEWVAGKNPNEPLLPTLRRGYSKANVLFMRVAVNRLDNIQEIEEDVQSDIDEDAADPVLIEINRAIAHQYGLLNKQSNFFHQCTTDQERAKNSDLVLAIWDRITALFAKRDHYNLYQELPDEPDELPDNTVELVNKRNSLRARVSQTKRELEKIAKGEAAASSVRVNELEQRIKDFNYTIGIINKRLEND